MKFIGILFLQCVLVGVASYRLRPVSNRHYSRVVKQYGPSKSYWNKYQYLQSNFKNFYKSRQDNLYNLRRVSKQQRNSPVPYPKISLGGRNARVIPLQVGQQALQKWQRAEFEFDYSKRPRMCPRDFISKCYRAPYLEIKGKTVRKCLTLCKGKPCFKPCVCECLPKYKVKFSKALIPHLLVPVDKRQLIPACNFNHVVSCRAQIYGEATHELCALGCGEGVCPLTCNCQCVPDTTPFIFPEIVPEGIATVHSGPRDQLIPGLGVGLSTDLGNGIILEGMGIGESGVTNLIGTGPGADFGPGVEFIGVDTVAVGGGQVTTGNGDLIIADNAGDLLRSVGGREIGPGIIPIFENIDAITNGVGGRTVITDGLDGVILDNGISVIGSGGGGQPHHVIGRGGGGQLNHVIDVPAPAIEPVTLFTPVDGIAARPPPPIVPDIVAPLQGIETETVQVKIDVQSPTAPNLGPGGAMGNTPGEVLVHNSADNVAKAAPGDVLVHNSAMMKGQSDQQGIPVSLPQDAGTGGGGWNPSTGSGINDWNVGSVTGMNDLNAAATGASSAWNAGSSNAGWNEGLGVGSTSWGSVADQGFSVGGQGAVQTTGSQGGTWNDGTQGGFTKGANQGGSNQGGGGGANVQQGSNGGLKLNIPPAGNKQGGAINLDLSGILNQITGSSGGEGNGGEGLFNNQPGSSPFGNLFVADGGNPLGGSQSPSPFDLFGTSQKRSDTSPMGKLGPEFGFDAFNFGAMAGLGEQGGAGTGTSKNGLDAGMASVFSALMGGTKPEAEDRCLKGTTKTCSATIEWSHTPGLDKWCKENCPKGICDKERCNCTCQTRDELVMPKMV